jgi:hypothetical protein
MFVWQAKPISDAPGMRSRRRMMRGAHAPELTGRL